MLGLRYGLRPLEELRHRKEGREVPNHGAYGYVIVDGETTARSMQPDPNTIPLKVGRN